MTDPRPSCEFDAEDLRLSLDVTVSGSIEAITPVVDEIMSVIRVTDCAKGHEFEIETAVREALANAIVHGCSRDPEKQVQVWVGCDESKGTVIVVRDPGPGFDPGDVPNPLTGKALYSNHGRGIYLINQLMDEVRFEKGGTEIWMRKK